MKSNENSERSSATLLIGTVVGILSIVLLAMFYYFSTNTHLT
ncbi:hypothetical protein [Leptolyngbya sp. NIES-2104]|nr:hypothetical protein [Leptolyngbya sp. NIES-2104]GAP94085.1 hypothetical protein NIES2104_05950 [Leptolyngbya sp. NIES-2104]